MAKYCKIIEIKSEFFWGTEIWILTHECGKVEKRTKRRRNSRHIEPAPKRVKCDEESEVE